MTKSERFARQMAKNWKPEHIFLHFTGSVYGMGCSALSAAGLERLGYIKSRPGQKGWMVLIPGLDALAEYGVELTPLYKRLAQQYWPGNLSMALKVDDPRLQHVMLDGKVGFRVPYSQYLRAFLRKIGHPVVSTSVNLPGEPPLNDYRQIIPHYRSWFDFEALPQTEVRFDAGVSTLIDCQPGQPQLLRQGSIPFEEIEQSIAAPLILFTCTGNIARSPLAQYLLQNWATKHGVALRVESAGELDLKSAMAPPSLRLLHLVDIDGRKHLSRPYNADLLRKCWKVFTMTSSQKEVLLAKHPWAEDKVFTLSEATGFDTDVPDPYGGETQEYLFAQELILARLNRLTRQLGTELELNLTDKDYEI